MNTGVSLLSRVSASMQRIAPLSLAALDWDNVGILLEAAQPRPDAKKVFLTIDLTTATLNEALSDPSVGVIVAYHPPIFSAWKSLSMGNLKQSLVLKCAAAGVSIYSPHTSLDSCSNGVNDWLASLVGQGSVVPITAASAESAAGQENVGEGRVVQLATPRTLTQIVEGVKGHLGLKHLRVARAPVHVEDQKPVSRIAICAGSGSSVLSKAVDADLYFTGEMGHHDVLAAVAKDVSCILAEHTNTERGYLHKILRQRLQSELDKDGAESPVDVVVSQADCDPISIE
ncbi:NGG1p interacting factor 3 [Martensiomyces pterosporus]|nr:NGG1p interacting factor 3 [Martensiomyces pterosporus]